MLDMIAAAWSRIRGTSRRPAAMVSGPVGYDWRYLDTHGADVTRQLLTGAVSDRCEAWSADGRLLLAVQRDGSSGWRIVGGDLDSGGTRCYGSPFDALDGAAAVARLRPVESRRR